MFPYGLHVLLSIIIVFKVHGIHRPHSSGFVVPARKTCRSGRLCSKNTASRTGPNHVAIIPDGNRRWAMTNGLPRVAGHTAGASKLREVVDTCLREHVLVVTIFAFSTENWKRDPIEVAAIWRILEATLRQERSYFLDHRIFVHPIGQIDRLPQSLKDLLESMGEDQASVSFASSTVSPSSSTNSDADGVDGPWAMVLNLALSYGARAEIADAARALATRVQSGEMTLQSIDENSLGDMMQRGMSGVSARFGCDPDLVIRTSGEQRLSNFLLWQTAYAELYTSSVLWPDFGEEKMLEALSDFRQRKRRFGG
mmetsp:Transcript_39133/g.53057  ORF Transcript_39133/g.53057 Transcript_39133/m.53057 type:complete len:311 (-) Transcript_39133:277-1209(-)